MREYLDRLTNRERILVVSGIGLIIFLIILLLVKSLLNFRNNLTEKLLESRSGFSQMDKIIKDYNYFRNLRQSPGESDVSAIYAKLDAIMVRYNIKEKVSTQKDSTTIVKKDYNKISIDISFRSVALQDVLKMIYDIEKNKEINGKIDYLNFKKPFSDKETYDVNLKFSSYSRISQRGGN